MSKVDTKLAGDVSRYLAGLGNQEDGWRLIEMAGKITRLEREVEELRASLEHAGRGDCPQCKGLGLCHASPDPSVIGTGPCNLCGGSGKGAPDFSQPPAPAVPEIGEMPDVLGEKLRNEQSVFLTHATLVDLTRAMLNATSDPKQ